MSSDQDFMHKAVALARTGLGNTAENPAVGCLIVKDGMIVGQGVTQPSGRPHAEVVALQEAGDLAEAATAYVTLEPCAHQGKTGPCSQALINANVSRVVIACIDPDPRVSGKGISLLENAGVQVTLGIGKADAGQDLAGFMSKVDRQRPLVTLKMATSLDGRVALANGLSQWITGQEARVYGHQLRAWSDAVLTGSGSVMLDDARLTARLPGFSGAQPKRFVLDRRGRCSAQAKIFADQDLATTTLVTQSPIANWPTPTLPYQGETALLEYMAQAGIKSLLLETGPALATSWLKQGLVDRLAWFIAPKLIGADGLAGLADLGLEQMNQITQWRVLESQTLGSDYFVLLGKPELEDKCFQAL